MDDEVCVVGRDVGNLLTNRDLSALCLMSH